MNINLPKTSCLAAVGLVLLQMLAMPQRTSAAAMAGIFCNGDGGNNMGSPTDASGLTTSQINGFRASGLTTMTLFAMSILTNGDFVYDGQTICSGGSYVGTTDWGTLLNQCRAAPSSINRIEMCLGGAGDASWTNLKNLIAANGTSSSTVLYQNLSALANALGINAINSDDETTYDSTSAVKFGQMCAQVGLHLTLCPYTNPAYWQAIQSALGSSVCDRVYLQCYQGGAGNDPAAWAGYLGVPVAQILPGYWDNERNADFLTNMLAWSKEGCTGGWLWPTCEQCTPPAGPGEMQQYADWMLGSFEPVISPVTAADVVGSQMTFTATFGAPNVSYQWQMIGGGVTNTISGATNLSLTLFNLQLSNTAAYQLQASNASGLVASIPSTLSVSSPPAAVNNVIASAANQTGMGNGFTLTPTWSIAPGSAIYSQAPSQTNGNFSEEVAGRNIDSLTANVGLGLAQIAGTYGNTTSTNYVTGGNGTGPDGSSAGSTLVYTLTNSSAGGYNLTNITVYGGWADGGRDQQAYTIYYSELATPATFILLRSVNYLPPDPANAQSATRLTLTPAAGALATNVAAVKFDFTSPASENGYCGYAHIALYGTPLAPVVATNTLPVTAADVVGSQVTFTAAFTAASPLTYQWRVIGGGATNNIPGATSTTLTLTNLQLTNTAAYQLQATNAYGVALSEPASLTVSPVPSPVNNIITSYAAQTGAGPSDAIGNPFPPTWTITTNNSLIAGHAPGSTSGDFSEEIPGRSVNSLTAGGNDAITVINGTYGYTTSTNYVTCGNGAGSGGNAGSIIVYTLTGATNGYDLTNITVYGGWGDAGRDQQAYTVYYSAIAAPANFIQLDTVNYTPGNPANVPCATRATLTAAAGALATNVAAVKFDFTSPASENGYCGYSQIELFGIPVPAQPSTVPTNITFQITASVLTLSWPADHIGWQLQAQTNSPAEGLGTNWVNVAGAALTNQVSLPVDPTVGSVFYRLAYP